MNATFSANGSLSPNEARPIPGRLSPSIRRVSSERMDTPARSINGEPQMPTSGLSPPSENGSPWSSAVGHATTAGKSGRVIERLMSENDRLKKDLELQVLRSQELERNLQTMRPQLEALRTENSNLAHTKSVDGSLMARRDRKIESLKEELATERSRREASEALARRHERVKEEIDERARRDIRLAQEEAKHATTHASILEQSHRQLSTEYRQRAERWKKDIDQIQAERYADRQKVARLEIVSDQMRAEHERTRKVQGEFVERWEEYRNAADEWKDGMQNVAQADSERSRKLSQDMETVTNQMKWVMGLDKSRRRQGSL